MVFLLGPRDVWVWDVDADRPVQYANAARDGV